MIAAIVILIVTAIIAKVVKNLASKHLVKVKALNRNGGGGNSLAESIGSIVSLVIWILGLIPDRDRGAVRRDGPEVDGSGRLHHQHGLRCRGDRDGDAAQ